MLLNSLLLFAILAAPAHANDAPSSFNQIRSGIYAEPETGLDCYPGINLGNVVRSLLHMRDILTDRAKWTFAHTSDVKPPGAKPLHPMGVCADAKWKIDGSSPYTGLFAPGAEANAIVRFSTGNPITIYNPGHLRVFGLAMKLYPSTNPDKEVESRNLLLLDQTGLTGDDRPRYLTKENGPLYWQNIAVGGGAKGRIINHIFERFDSHPLIRPLKPMASVTSDGQPVATPVSPDIIHLVPDLSHTMKAHTASDFRDELLAYDAEEIRFAITRADTGARIGTVTLGKPVVSEYCDERLHFHHDSN